MRPHKLEWDHVREFNVYTCNFSEPPWPVEIAHPFPRLLEVFVTNSLSLAGERQFSCCPLSTNLTDSLSIKKRLLLENVGWGHLKN